MKKALQITLGIVTSIGGFIDAGAFATSLQAGARFGLRLLWATLLGTLCVIFLTEMSGRLAVVSHHPVRELVHERFGFPFSAALLLGCLALDLLVLASEIGGVAMAAQLATGVSFRWWALPAALAIWALLWFLTFGVMEKAVALAGLVTLAFVIAAIRLHAAPAGAPLLAPETATKYEYMAVSIIGAIITPSMLFFYSSGAIEDRWDKGHLGVNRAVAVLGMGFGAAIALGIMAVAAGVLGPRGIRAESYGEAARMLEPVFGGWGVTLFVASLGITSFGAAVEVALSGAYEVAQTFGWNWGKAQKARHESRFTLTYTVMLALGAIPIASGVEPLKLTVFTMAISCLILPFITFPFLVLMNDREYLGEQVNPRWANYAVAGIVMLTFVLALVAIPLQLMGGS